MKNRFKNLYSILSFLRGNILVNNKQGLPILAYNNFVKKKNLKCMECFSLSTENILPLIIIIMIIIISTKMTCARIFTVGTHIGIIRNKHF